MKERFRIYPWHSINLIPQFSCVIVASDEPPHKNVGTCLEIVLFGYIAHIILPWALFTASTPCIGPLWSRKRRIWYRSE